MSDWQLPRALDDFAFRGIDTVFLENEHLRIMVLPGKGGDILEFRDKRADVDVLWHADHNWQPPGDRTVPSLDATTWHDHYPGGWQVNLPVAGYTEGFGDAPYGLHGESSLVEFDSRIDRGDEVVALELEADLVRYPFHIERRLSLPSDEPTLRIEESVTNTGGRSVPYIWQHHIALGRPLVGPDARLDIPTETGIVDDYEADRTTNRLQGGSTFEWPEAPGDDGGTVDLSKFPATDSTIHDVTYATELDAGWFAATNSEIDLGFSFSFPTDPFESIWYWQAFGGYRESPYYNRNYTAGLEPTTAYPSGGIPEQQAETGTLKELEAGETKTATFSASTYHGVDRVEGIDDTGAVVGR